MSHATMDRLAEATPPRLARRARGLSDRAIAWIFIAPPFLDVTHDQIEAMTMASRIGLLAEGRLVQVAPPPATSTRTRRAWLPCAGSLLKRLRTMSRGTVPAALRLKE